MGDVTWRGEPDGRYWIDVLIGGESARTMVDLGLVDPLQAVGFELEPAFYDGLKHAGDLTRFQYRFRRDASGQIAGGETGRTQAQLLHPVTRQAVGPVVRLHVSRGAPGVPSRVGVAFFHALLGCQVHWDLTDRTWCIGLP